LPLNRLFQFIIRYEGEGIIDGNVVELFKSWQKSSESDGAGASLLLKPWKTDSKE